MVWYILFGKWGFFQCMWTLEKEMILSQANMYWNDVHCEVLFDYVTMSKNNECEMVFIVLKGNFFYGNLIYSTKRNFQIML